MIPAEDCIDLASELLGGAALAASDEFFAPKENLVKAAAPVWIPEKYTEFGKWMDGWETRRWRTPETLGARASRPLWHDFDFNKARQMRGGPAEDERAGGTPALPGFPSDLHYDWCVVRLGLPGILRAVDIDTTYFTGNFPSHASVEMCSAPDGDWQRAEWSLALPKVRLQGVSHNLFDVDGPAGRRNHVRLNIFPDGGVARLRVYGEGVPDLAALARSDEPVDFASVANGGLVLAASDAYFGAKSNLIMPGRPAAMGDGWETRRRRGSGYDWIIVRLGARCSVEQIAVETEHFKGNYPDLCSIEACNVEAPEPEDLCDDRRDDLITGKVGWQEILAPAKLGPDAVHVYQGELAKHGPFTHVRLNIYPDGGISRLRVFGRIAG